jgi:hypothetical protein
MLHALCQPCTPDRIVTIFSERAYYCESADFKIITIAFEQQSVVRAVLTLGLSAFGTTKDAAARIIRHSLYLHQFGS